MGPVVAPIDEDRRIPPPDGTGSLPGRPTRRSGALLAFAQGSALAPFIYTVF